MGGPTPRKRSKAGAPRRPARPRAPTSRTIIVTFLEDPKVKGKERVIVQTEDFDRFAVAPRLRIAADVHEALVRPQMAAEAAPEE